MSARGKTLVKGHTLVREGKPFDADGKRIALMGDRRYGHGKCSCGALSVGLHSDARRKRWHAAHKAEIAGVCPQCDGHGDIWTNWHPTPVTCGHCHGTGIQAAPPVTPASEENE